MRAVRWSWCRGDVQGVCAGWKTTRLSCAGVMDTLRVKCDVELTSVQVLGREFKITFLRDLL